MVSIADYKGKRVHMIGIGGSSMSGLADMLIREGYQVTGSDNTLSHTVEKLQQQGVQVFIGHFAENVHGAELLIFSAAIAEDNPERAEARRLGIPEMERAILLGQLMLGHEKNICISGAHGKTTVSSMIAMELIEAGMDPAVSIGGRPVGLGTGSRVGSHRAFVAEACEFHGSFLHMHPTLAVVLNIDADHLDYYGDMAHIEQAFEDFLRLLPPEGIALGWGEDERIRRIFSRLSVQKYTFGLKAENDFYPGDLQYNDHGCGCFDVMYRGESLGRIELKMAGEFNVTNALAAFAAGFLSGAEKQQLAASLTAFSGVHRRFELTGVTDGVELYHDYGHNPPEMQAAVHVAVLHRPRRVIAVMQPHTYSRVKTLFDGYLTCTREADLTLVTDIFAAREKDPGDIHATMVVEGMQKQGVNAVYTPTFDDVENYLRAHWQPGDLVITMGCGNINLLNEQIAARGNSEGYTGV